MDFLQKMQPEDIDEVVALITAHDDDDGEEAEKNYREPNGTEDHYVIREDNQIIGTTGYLTPPACDNTYYLSWTYVREDKVNQGWGSKMLSALFEQLPNGRMIFVKVSDYVDEDNVAIYAAALHLYQKMGFVEEVRHADYYDDQESQIILGKRLKTRQAIIEEEYLPQAMQFNGVYELAETDDAYTFSWTDETYDLLTEEDVNIGVSAVKEQQGRAIFLALPSTYQEADAVLRSAGFKKAGCLSDYFEDGIDENHYSLYL